MKFCFRSDNAPRRIDWAASREQVRALHARSSCDRTVTRQGALQLQDDGVAKRADHTIFELMQGATRYLMMSEFNGPNREDELLTHGARLAASCDLLVMMYSQSSLDSFKYLVSLEQRHKHALAKFPRVYFANKADEKAEPFKNPSPQSFTSSLKGVPPPVSLSLDTPRGEQQQGLYVSICRAAAESPHAIAGSTALFGSPLRALLFGGVLVGIGAAAFMAFNLFNNKPLFAHAIVEKAAAKLSGGSKAASTSASPATVSAGSSVTSFPGTARK
jgi:hypothetical protein